MSILNDIDRRGFTGQRGGIDQRGQPPPTSIGINPRKSNIGIGDPQQVIKQHQILGVRVGDPVAHSITGGLTVKTLHTGGRAQQPGHGMEGDLPRVRLAKGSEHPHITPTRNRCDLTRQTALADAGWPDHTDHSTVAIDCAVQQTLDGGQLPPSTDKIRRRPLDSALAFTYAHQAMGGNWFLGTLNTDHLRFTESRCAINKSRGGRREHHPARRSNRLHPLSHPHLLTNSGVTERPRTHFTGDHLTRVQADPQLQLDTVAVLDVDGEPLRLVLDTEGRQTGANGVILQRHRCPEHGHDAVAGETADRAAVPLDHPCRTVDQIGHDLAQPLRTHGRRDVHRMNNIGEQHRDLLVLRRSGGRCDWRAALTTKLGCAAQLSAARPTGQSRHSQATATVPTAVHVSIVSPLVSDVRRIAVPSPTRRL